MPRREDDPRSKKPRDDLAEPTMDLESVGELEAAPADEEPFAYDDLVADASDDGAPTHARLPIASVPAPKISLTPLSSPRPSWPPLPERPRAGAALPIVIPPSPVPRGLAPSARPSRPPEPIPREGGDTRKWTARAEAFLEQIERARSREQRVRLYRELAELLEQRLDDPEQAFDVLVAALSEDVADDATARALDRVARQTERFGELIQTAQAWLEEPETKGDPARTLAISLRLAKWYGEDVDRPEWALPYLERAQALAPRDPRPLRMLARLLRRTGEIDRAGATLTSALELATSSDDRKAIHAEIGALLAKEKGQPEAAIASYRRALDLDPGWLPALDALEGLLRDRGEPQAVAELLETKLALALPIDGDADGAGTRVRLAELYAGPLANPERATRLLEEAIERDPRHAGAHRALTELHRRRGDAQGLRAALERRLESASTAREKLDLLHELAALLERTFLEPELAAYRLEQALAIAPDDEATLEALVRIFGRLRRYDDVASMLEHYAPIAREPRRREELYLALARTVEHELGDRARAVSAWTALAALSPDHPEAAAALSRLDVRAGDPEAAIQRLRRAAVHATEPAQRAIAHHALGAALEAARDREAAREAYLDAIDDDPDHLPSLHALRRLAIDGGDARGALRFLEREIALTGKPRPRAMLLAKLGALRAQLAEPADAREAWEQAVALDPDVDEALRPLAEACVAAGDFARAEPMIATLRTRGSTTEDARRLAALHGRALSGLGRDDDAGRVLAEAQRLAPHDPEVLDALADATWKAQDWPAALDAHQRLLETLGDDDRRLEVLHRLGVIQRALGKPRAAIATLDHLLSSAPDHRPSLETLASIHAEQGDWQGFVDCQRQLADTTVDVDQRLAALDAIADAWWGRVGDAGPALATLEEALSERPRDLPRLHRVLAIAEATRDWPRVHDTLERVVEIESNPQRRAKYVLTLGQLQRDALGEPEKALASFERALDDDPTQLKAFEAIDRLLTGARDWRRLERAYRKMLHRVARAQHDDAVEHQLWAGLGHIYRDRLHDDVAAAEAFAMAAKLRPDDPRTRRILAELHERSGRAADAASELQAIIAREPRRAEPYHQLYRLYRRQGAFDRAFCVASALAFLRAADAEQHAYLAQLATEAPREPLRALDLAAFAQLFPRDHDVVLGKLFELLAPALRSARLLRLAAEGRLAEPPPGSLQDPATSALPIVRDVAIVSGVLGLPTPRISARLDVAGGLAPLRVEPPTTLVGAGALAIASPYERRFAVARHLARLRGELSVTTLVAGPSELKALSLSALQLSHLDVALPDDLARVAADTSRELGRYLQPVQLEAVRKVMKRFVERGGQADVKAWWKTADRTALRLAVLLTGEVAIAARAAAAEPVGPYDPSPDERIDDALAWAVGEEHFALRELLGIRAAD